MRKDIVITYAYAWLEKYYPEKEENKKAREAVARFAAEIERMMYGKEKN